MVWLLKNFATVHQHHLNYCDDQSRQDVGFLLLKEMKEKWTLRQVK